MLNQRLAAMGRGERSPQEVKSIRYEDMREILLNNYKENKISLDKLEMDAQGKPTGLNHTGLKFLEDHFKGMRLQQIDTDVLRAYRKSRTCGDTTINRDLTLLRRMIVLTVQERKLQFTMPHFPMTSEAGNARQGFVEPAKFDELLNAMPEHLRPYLLFYYETGCRPKATRKIVWDWVSLDEGMIYIPDNTTKNSEPLPVPISHQLCGMLKKLFRTGSAFDTTNFRKAFQAACVAVKLGVKTGPKSWQYSGLKPYDLRRSAVRNLSRAGVLETVAMKISGHKTRSVFDRYNITSVADVKEAMEKVSKRNASLIQAVKKWQLQIAVNASVLLVKAEVAQW
jgi:integrase